jgi:6-phosphogluconate dehydrogenase
MEIAFIGLGRMGLNMLTRLAGAGHTVVGFDRNAGAVAKAKENGGKPASSVAEAVAMLKKPRAVWMMIPSGQPVDDLITELQPMLEAGDLLVDGGNSNYKDSKRRARSGSWCRPAPRPRTCSASLPPSARRATS